MVLHGSALEMELRSKTMEFNRRSNLCGVGLRISQVASCDLRFLHSLLLEQRFS